MKLLKFIFEAISYLVKELCDDFEIGDNFDQSFGTYKGKQYYEYSLKNK
ncbi:Uncharacterised protein [Acetobacterium wieringae]|nr:hypothetical protein [Acetobacterium wieringae]VUZ28552.1 Uncharacterised protein [Acetobacterium wieringae]